MSSTHRAPLPIPRNYSANFAAGESDPSADTSSSAEWRAVEGKSGRAGLRPALLAGALSRRQELQTSTVSSSRGSGAASDGPMESDGTVTHVPLAPETPPGGRILSATAGLLARGSPPLAAFPGDPQWLSATGYRLQLRAQLRTCPSAHRIPSSPLAGTVRTIPKSLRSPKPADSKNSIVMAYATTGEDCVWPAGPTHPRLGSYLVLHPLVKEQATKKPYGSRMTPE